MEEEQEMEKIAEAATATILCVALSLPCQTWKEHTWRDNWQSYLHWSRPSRPRDVIFLDFSEVSGTVSHSILLDNLSGIQLGVTSGILQGYIHFRTSFLHKPLRCRTK